MNKVTPGAIVHYVAYGTPGGEYEAGAHRAAIIAEVNKQTNTVSLCVFNPTGIHFNEGLYQSEDHKGPGTWHFPEKV